MADSRFFVKSKDFSLRELVELTGSELGAGAAPERVLSDVAPLDIAGPDDLSFLDNVKYKDQFLTTRAGACFVHPSVTELAPRNVCLLLNVHPYKAYALAAQAFYPDAKPNGEISEQAYIDPSARIGGECTIGPGVVVGAGVEIGEASWIEANSVIGDNVRIGAYCRIGSNATLSHCHIGDYTRLYPGVRVGQDGFGFAIDPKGHVKVPQLGRVIIEDHVEIGANTTIDRGAGPDTIIGQGTWIDNLVQIGHNVRIGRGCVIVAQVGISGSTVIEDFVVIGGQAGVTGHLHIGSGARIAAQSGVMRNVPAGEEYMGSPAMPIRDNMKQVALLKRLIKKNKG
ncbi:MAG TPA: UDP-3-O-(3-hydroxymyristoyl)glucosamine N-acyltransferase [Alphaproteobacteria bacterium]|nr:UDP-3-O-(3-hydroxymyristoyl)glucosamine N-acyltransferase [Alphaproteobacteria bacterium]USO06142.1 MAG: UDP-3-O-(3-hydroxymyristoyl)glucosamine N-acyltransferase [Rhodospirillales bacterium]HOO82855.1 UDP-3-O-(3-hydroxymyristoyl)glucosamine N-acyltransferase [Alphaproteobacteria bacterium]